MQQVTHYECLLNVTVCYRRAVQIHQAQFKEENKNAED
jgi:hypothetical protein